MQVPVQIFVSLDSMTGCRRRNCCNFNQSSSS